MYVEIPEKFSTPNHHTFLSHTNMIKYECCPERVRKRELQNYNVFLPADLCVCVSKSVEQHSRLDLIMSESQCARCFQSETGLSGFHWDNHDQLWQMLRG